MTDLIIAMSIIIFLSSVTFVVANFAIRKSKITGITSEISLYRTAIANFKDTYKFYPGDVPISATSTNNFPTNVVNNAVKISNYCVASGNNETWCTHGTQNVTPIKGLNAFLQLAASDNIDKKIVNPDYTVVAATNPCLNNATENFNSMSGILFPKSNSIKNAIFMFGIDDSKSNRLEMPKNSTLYLTANYSKYSSRPRIILFNPAQYTISSSCEIAVGGLAGSVKNGVVSGSMAYEIDKKIDDNLALAGNVLGENSTAETTTSCVQSGSYSGSQDDSNDYGCVMTFILD